MTPTDLIAFLSRLQVDLQATRATLSWGPTIVRNVSLQRLDQLIKDPELIEKMLSEFFLTRRIMWHPTENEDAGKLRGGLTDMTTSIDEFRTLLATDSQGNKLPMRLLSEWSGPGARAAAELKMAVELEEQSRRDPTDSGAFLEAKAEFPRIMGAFRAQTYPIVSLLVDMLPPGNVLRARTKDKLEEGTNYLIREYNMSSGDIPAPTWSLANVEAPE